MKEYVNGEKVFCLEIRPEENHPREGLNLCLSELSLDMEAVHLNMVGLIAAFMIALLSYQMHMKTL